VQFLPVARDFSLLQSIWIGYGAQPDSFSVGTGGTVARALKFATYLHVFMTLGMHAAAVPLPHVPLWQAQGQLYHYSNTVCLVGSSGMRKTGLAYTGEMRNAYKFFTGKSEGKRPLD
jgi:hypothetical protein